MTDFRRGLDRTPRIRAPYISQIEPQAPPHTWQAIRDLWGLNKDTQAIALTLGLSESAVYNSLPRARANG